MEKQKIKKTQEQKVASRLKNQIKQLDKQKLEYDKLRIKSSIEKIDFMES